LKLDQQGVGCDLPFKLPHFIILDSIKGEKVRSTENIIASGVSYWSGLRIKPNHVVMAQIGDIFLRECHLYEVLPCS